MNQKVYGALGLSRRAGECIAGDFAVERAVKAEKAVMVIVDSMASGATRGRYRTMCDTHGIAYVEIPDIGRAIGKPNGKIAAVMEEAFASMIQKAITESNE